MNSKNLKCKCFERPFEPPKGCFEYCVAKILSYAKPHDLVKYFNFTTTLADKIFNITANDSFKGLSEFKPPLTIQEYEFIENKFRNLDAKGWIWIKHNIKKEMGIPAFD